MIYKDKVFYKYLTVSEETKRWGLYLTGAGYTEVCNEAEYPCPDYPEHHYFHWSNGRRISEFQILFITRGGGVFESELSSKKIIKAGDLFMLFPDVWHRFSPYKSTGWNEYFIEFNGIFANYLLKNSFLSPKEPVIRFGIGEELTEQFLRIIKLVRDEEITFQFAASANVLKILGLVSAQKISGKFKGEDIESQIRQAKAIISDNIGMAISPEKIAKELGISYSLFRKKFRKYTGFSPIQYQIQIRIQKARDLLINTNKSIKEIADKSGFESTYYFSRLFKQKTGKSPSEVRMQNRR